MSNGVTVGRACCCCCSDACRSRKVDHPATAEFKVYWVSSSGGLDGGARGGETIGTDDFGRVLLGGTVSGGECRRWAGATGGSFRDSVDG